MRRSKFTMRTDDLDGAEPRPEPRRLPRRGWRLALGLWLLAAVTRFWIAPQWERLPADYAEETSYQAQSRARETPTGKWEDTPLIARRVDQTLVASGDTAIVQGDVHWSTQAGQVLFETAGIYGVDRRNLRNLSGYGNVDRSGQFLFPTHLQRAVYRYWDPLYVGPRTATFERSDAVAGLAVYVFHFTARDLDETAGFSHLPDVPERYQAHTDADGTLWIEPNSGIVVDYQERGVSYFFEAATRRRVADLFVWSDHFTPQTRAAQLKLATAARLRSKALEGWLPLALLLCGALCFAPGRRRRLPLPGSTPASPSAQGPSAQGSLAEGSS